MQTSRGYIQVGTLLGGLILGLAVGAFGVYAGLMYLQENNLAGDWDERVLFSDEIQQLRINIERESQLQEDFISGIVQHIDDTSLILQGYIGDEERLFTLVITEDSEFVTQTDAEFPEEVAITPTDIEVGDTVTITTNIPVGRATNINVLEVVSLLKF